MKISLPGGSGFLGRHLLRRLRPQRHELATLERSPTAAEAVLRERAGSAVPRAATRGFRTLSLLLPFIWMELAWGAPRFQTEPGARVIDSECRAA